MIEVQDKCFCRPKAIGSVADNLGLIVETFHSSVMDRLCEVAEYILFMASEYPGKVS
jgi:hypothetical protein